MLNMNEEDWLLLVCALIGIACFLLLDLKI